MLFAVACHSTHCCSLRMSQPWHSAGLIESHGDSRLLTWLASSSSPRGPSGEPNQLPTGPPRQARRRELQPRASARKKEEKTDWRARPSERALPRGCGGLSLDRPAARSAEHSCQMGERGLACQEVRVVYGLTTRHSYSSAAAGASAAGAASCSAASCCTRRECVCVNEHWCWLIRRALGMAAISLATTLAVSDCI